jgi:DNA-binding NarL/FixJ family response regulator
MIRLLIVDDHQLMRDGLVRLLGLEEEVEIVGTASDGTEALEKVAELQPNLVLMDVRMPTMSGIAATREIKTRYPQTEVVLLTMHDEDEYVFEGLSAGASGYLLKDASHDELMSTLRQVSAGQAQIAPSVTRKLVREFASLRQARPEPGAAPAAGPTPSRPPELSRREYEVLTLLVRGCSNRQIANELFIDETTVKTHLHRVFEKLQVRDRTQAAILAVQRGWCPQAPVA